jgi:hypothetical protein
MHEATRSTVAAALAVCALSAAAGGVVEVGFVEPKRFADAGRTPMEIERTTRSLAAFLQSLGALLPEGSTLRLQVSDVDLAGIPRYDRTDRDVRVIDGRGDWPRITLRYELVEGERVVATGAEEISDLDYFSRPQMHLPDTDLPYEKRMLANWFRSRFAPPP